MRKSKEFDTSGTDAVGKEEMARVIAQAWHADLLPQREVCEILRINQGQFSRIVRGQFKHARGHAADVFAYAKRTLEERETSSVHGLREIEERLTKQLLETWDQTPEGARALSSILAGVQQLRARPR